MAIHDLYPLFRPMEEDDQANPKVSGFQCGPERWSELVAQYLRSGAAWQSHSTGSSDTLLFCARDDRNHILGFVDLAEQSLSWPKANGKRKAPSLHIKYIALATSYHGQPNLPSTSKYAHRMLTDIVDLAIQDSRNFELLSLVVDQDNQRAIRLYDRFGFVDHGKPRADESDSSITYIRKVLPIR